MRKSRNDSPTFPTLTASKLVFVFMSLIARDVDKFLICFLAISFLLCENFLLRFQAHFFLNELLGFFCFVLIFCFLRFL